MTETKKGSFTHSSERSDWMTPPWIVNCARLVLGKIDLDPASCKRANDETVKAAKFYDGTSPEMDGLTQPWVGRVFLNAPWGKTIWHGKEISSQDLWTRTLVWHWNKDDGVTACVSVWNAAVCQNWFQPHYSGPICIPRGRVQFLDPETLEPAGSNQYGSVIAYRGPKPDLFAKVFAKYGNILERRE